MFQLKLSQKVFYLIIYWYYMWFFGPYTSPTSMTNIQNTKHKTPNTGRSIVVSWLEQTCDLPHWHSSSLIKHFVVKSGPLSLGIRSHTCHLRASKSDSGKQQSSHGLWPYELILRQMHSKGTNLKPLLLDQNIMLIFIFFQTSAIFRGQWQTFKSLQPHKRGNTKVLLSWHISANNPSKQKQTGQ